MTESFGAGPDETLLREIAFAAYANRTAAHEDVAFTLHISRATYFRRLRQATERICDYLVAAATAQARAA
jgi:predicted DNA-binding protein (UPF0251 family)